jgi:hypothetical protein
MSYECIVILKISEKFMQQAEEEPFLEVCADFILVDDSGLIAVKKIAPGFLLR